MKVIKQSLFTGKVRTMDLPITEEELKRWKGGELIQHVWPELTPDQREFLITGVTAEEWGVEFGEEWDREGDSEVAEREK